VHSRGVTRGGAAAGAIVIGGDYQGLGIIRSLGRRGIPTCVIDDEQSIGRFSRYATYSVRARNLRHGTAAVDATLAAVERFGLRGWVLYPTRDEHVAAFGLARERLRDFVRVPTPSWDVVRWLYDKRNTYELAQRIGVPTPRWWLVDGVKGLRDVGGEAPWAVKPAIKDHFFYATKAKAWRANSREELRELVARASDLVGRQEVIVQELIPGNGESQQAFCAFFRDAEAIASMVVERRRQHPPEFGRASTYVRTIESPQLEEWSCRLLREIDYYGLVELEFKVDPRDGQPKLLDANARTWGYHTLGASAGVDFPYLLYCDQVGSPVTPGRALPERTWLRLATDLPVGVLAVLRRQIRLTDYLRTLWNADTEAVFARDDWLPGMAEVALIPYLALRRGF